MQTLVVIGTHITMLRQWVPVQSRLHVVNVSVFLATAGSLGFSPLSRFSGLRLLFFSLLKMDASLTKKEECIKIKEDCCTNQPHFKGASAIWENVHQHERLNSEIRPHPEISPTHASFCRRVSCMSQSITDERKQRPEPVGRVNLSCAVTCDPCCSAL